MTNLLLVEDDKDLSLFLSETLRLEGFKVDMAADGLTGAQKAKVNDYDVIILDYGLPYKNGREICEELRKLGKTVRIVMLSVSSDVVDKVDLLTLGADDYVTKPFAFTELLARIHAVLRRPIIISHVIIEANGIILNLDSRTVIFQNKEIYLTLKEFDLLEYFMRNRGKALTRMNILYHVWDINADPFTNTVDTHILNLRKKLKDKNRKSLISTVPGVGYKMM